LLVGALGPIVEIAFCLWLEGVVESLFIANAIERVNKVSDRFCLDPLRRYAINIGFLQQRIDSCPMEFSLTPDALSHPPVIDHGLLNLLLSRDDHVSCWCGNQDAISMRDCSC